VFAEFVFEFAEFAGEQCIDAPEFADCKVPEAWACAASTVLNSINLLQTTQ